MATKDLGVSKAPPDRFVTRRGVEIRIVPLSDFTMELLNATVEREFRERGEPLDVPTYSYTAIGGDVLTAPLDADSLEDPDDPAQTEENKRLWAAYLDARKRLAAEQAERLLRAQLLLGAEIIGEEQPEFARTFKTLGIPIPEDADERKVMYLRDYAMNDAEMQEFLFLVQILMASTMVSTEEIEAAKATFRRGMGQGLGDYLRGLGQIAATAGAAGEAAETGGVEVEVLPALSGGEGGEGLGGDA